MDTGDSFTSNNPKSRDPIGPCARLMVAAGCDPTEPVTVKRGHVECFKPRPLGRWAEEDTYCLAKGGFRTQKYRSFSHGEGQSGGSGT